MTSPSLQPQQRRAWTKHKASVCCVRAYTARRESKHLVSRVIKKMLCTSEVLILLLSMLLISRSKDLWKILMNCRLHLFRSSASSFSSQYFLLFLKSSRSCVLLPTPFTSIICPLMAS